LIFNLKFLRINPLNKKQKFAVLQLSGCAGCEVSLLNAGEWIDQFELVYMPLVVSAFDVPEVDLLLVSGGIRNDEDLHNLRRAQKNASKIAAIGTCAISGGISNLGDRDEVREVFLVGSQRHSLPNLLPKCHPVDLFVKVDSYLPGCPPTPELFMALLGLVENFKPGRSVCQECNRKKKAELKPDRLFGFEKGGVTEGVCLINQGYLCIGSSTRGGCRALCTNPGHPCVGCRGPSDPFIEHQSSGWLDKIKRVFTTLTDVPEHEIDNALRSPQMSLFLFQFADIAGKTNQDEIKDRLL
jgi:F420-non-reducing hydrogenase small subunit